MTDAEIATIAKLIDVLRVRGVCAFDGGGIKLELREPAAPPSLQVERTTTAAVTENCKCGHPVWAHVGELCAEGCAPDRCARGDS